MRPSIISAQLILLSDFLRISSDFLCQVSGRPLFLVSYTRACSAYVSCELRPRVTSRCSAFRQAARYVSRTCSIFLVNFVGLMKISKWSSRVGVLNFFLVKGRCSSVTAPRGRCKGLSFILFDRCQFISHRGNTLLFNMHGAMRPAKLLRWKTIYS